MRRRRGESTKRPHPGLPVELCTLKTVHAGHPFHGKNGQSRCPGKAASKAEPSKTKARPAKCGGTHVHDGHHYMESKGRGLRQSQVQAWCPGKK